MKTDNGDQKDQLRLFGLEIAHASAPLTADAASQDKRPKFQVISGGGSSPVPAPYDSESDAHRVSINARLLRKVKFF